MAESAKISLITAPKSLNYAISQETVGSVRNRN
jgi:hypothetical protein